MISMVSIVLDVIIAYIKVPIHSGQQLTQKKNHIVTRTRLPLPEFFFLANLIAFHPTSCVLVSRSSYPPMTEGFNQSKISKPPFETSKTWALQTIGLSHLMSKEAELLKLAKSQEEWTKEQYLKLLVKDSELLDEMRKQRKWNDEQMGKDWYLAAEEVFAAHHEAINDLVVTWQKRHDDLEKELLET